MNLLDAVIGGAVGGLVVFVCGTAAEVLFLRWWLRDE